MKYPYQRVVLKLSGEVFGGGSVGVDPDVVAALADQIAGVVRQGIQVAIVVGGGNFFRGAELQKRGMERQRADYMGMLGTVMNCLALHTAYFSRGRILGVVLRVSSSLAFVPSISLTNSCVLVAIPLMRCMKLSASLSAQASFSGRIR